MKVDAATMLRIREIFFPYAHRMATEVQAKRQRFVHYTSAAVAESIIKSRRIWMRNAATMNDFLEVEHGLDLLASAYRGEPGKRLKTAVDSLFPETSKKVAALFDGWQPAFRRDTYLTCFSEHLDAEDDYGRLSMWRAYGGTAGIALVVKSDAFFLSSTALGAYSSPVLYAGQPAFDVLMTEVANNIGRESVYLKTFGEDSLISYLFSVFRYAALCTKHPGFAEEREWRVVHSRGLDESPHLEKSIATVRGTTQRICKIPFQDFAEEGLVGLEPNSLFDRIIIGPTEHPIAMADAFTDLLAEIGVERAREKVFVSDIPLR